MSTARPPFPSLVGHSFLRAPPYPSPGYLHSTPGYDIPCPTQLHTAHVPLMFAPAIREYMVRYSEISIPHTEFGIRKLEFGIWKPDNSCSALSYFAPTPVNIGRNRVQGILHGAVFSLLTTMDMVR